MLNLNKFQRSFSKTWFPSTLSTSMCRNFTSPSNPNTHPSSSACVAIFWDLDNKPPKSSPPFDAAIRLKQAAQKFGFVKYMIAYADRHAFTYVPPLIRDQRRDRKAINELENTCGVCGRKFYKNERLVNHFKEVHEREHAKRMNQIESARGKRRVQMVAKYAMKMEKYKRAARDVNVLGPRRGYGLADELKRAGFWVREVLDKPQSASVALKNHMMELMDRRAAECLVLVSDDSDFEGVLKEARSRCVKTVVVGDVSEGWLKRTADSSFSWEEIMIGKAREQAVSVMGKWKDGSVLRGLEWTYDPEREKKLYFGSDEEVFGSNESAPILRERGAWWEMESSDGDER